MPKVDPKSAIAIVRVSSKRQEGNTSRETQIKDISAYCENLGLKVKAIEPIIESAKDSAVRTRYHEIIEDGIRQGIKNIVFHRFDRESRNLTDSEHNETLVRKKIIILHYAQDRKTYDHNTPASEFLSRDINAAINKNYSRELSSKVNSAMNHKAENGWYPSNHVPLGYMTMRPMGDDGRERSKGMALVVQDLNESNVRQVKREFELRAKGLSFDEIIKTIVIEGLVSKHKISKYRKSALQYRLCNQFYWGKFLWKGKIYQGLHPIIIPQVHLDAVSDLEGKRGRSVRPKGVFGGGWLKCFAPECGCNVIYDPKVKVNKNSGVVRQFDYYHCTNGRKTHPSMAGLSLSEDKIWLQLEQPVARITIGEGLATEIAKALNLAQEKARDAICFQMEGFRAGLKRIEIEEDEVYRDFKNGVFIDEESYRRQVQRLRGERDRFTKLLETSQLQLGDAIYETAKSILELATNATLLWKSKSPLERRADLDLILSNPRLDGQTIRYDLKKPFNVLAKMTANNEWWAHLDEFRTACLELAA